MKYCIRIFFLLNLLLCGLSSSFAQKQYSTTNSKAIKIYENGLNYYDQRDNENAKKEMLKAIEKDPTFVEPHFVLANIFEENQKLDLAIEEYKKAIAKNPYFDPRALFVCAKAEFFLGRYEEAKDHMQKFLALPSSNTTAKTEANFIISSCNFALSAIANPTAFKPENLGPGINTKEEEYFPAITADEHTFLFTRRIQDAEMGYQEDFYYSLKQDGKWAEASNLMGPINSRLNEGAPALSADGQILIFTACELYRDGNYGPNRQGLGSCDLFFAKKRGANWGKPFNIGNPINSNNWETQPSFSSDGKTLYFIRGSVTREGIKNQDIYMSKLTEAGYWDQPVKLSDKINTPGREESVFIHPDNQTLYFASDGHIGMGGLDIYVSRKDENGEWGEPLNLGYPINTFGDENSLLVGAKGDVAYFASNREGGFGGLDIYSFELPKNLRPQMVTFMKGKVFNSETKEPLEAKFELLDLETGKIMVESYSNPLNGEFLVSLPVNKNYALNASKSGFLFYSENFSLKENGTAAKPTRRDVPLKPIKEGEKVVLKNVFYASASAALKDESKIELNKLVKLMEKNKTLKIEVSGHTDNVGDDASNLKLSESRAFAVYSYLLEQKIEAERISFKGYGKTQPIADNATEEGRSLNRRTEFMVVGK
jgi:outer membrane protein OmpA-like peptidoglycan-associated protein/tetratricopeptide (TPR) repeat protein